MSADHTDRSIAYQALNLANEAKRDIVAHEDLCAERYGNINDSIREIKGILKWAGGSAFTVIIGLLGWSLVQQINANEAGQRATLDAFQRQIAQQATPSANR